MDNKWLRSAEIERRIAISRSKKQEKICRPVTAELSTLRHSRKMLKPLDSREVKRVSTILKTSFNRVEGDIVGGHIGREVRAQRGFVLRNKIDSKVFNYDDNDLISFGKSKCDDRDCWNGSVVITDSHEDDIPLDSYDKSKPLASITRCMTSTKQLFENAIGPSPFRVLVSKYCCKTSSHPLTQSRFKVPTNLTPQELHIYFYIQVELWKCTRNLQQTHIDEVIDICLNHSEYPEFDLYHTMVTVMALLIGSPNEQWHVTKGILLEDQELLYKLLRDVSNFACTERYIYIVHVSTCPATTTYSYFIFHIYILY